MRTKTTAYGIAGAIALALLAGSTTCIAHADSKPADAAPSTDSNVATYAGNDMIVGGTQDSSGKPAMGYAAEAEGLTVVNRNLYANSGNAWGFTLGEVALGSGVAPERNATVIAVGGDSKAWSTPLQSIGNGQYGGENPDILEPMEPWYQRQPSLRVSLDSDQQPVVPGTQVTKSGAPLMVNGIDYTNFNPSAMSEDYAQWKSTDSSTVTKVNGANVSPAPVDNAYAVYGYDEPRDGDESWTGNNGAQRRKTTLKLDKEMNVTLTGDGTSRQQVFEIDWTSILAAFANGGYTGIDFTFRNIPDSASVLVNAKDATAATIPVGWRVWWNNGTDPKNDVQVAEQYWNDDSVTPNHAALRHAASSVMWNFKDGVTLSNSGTVNTVEGKAITGDAAAGWIGSIITPETITAQVTTNGRMYAGRDIFLYQPVASETGLGLERHNYPWNGDQATAPKGDGTLTWTKVGSDNESKPLAGSQWQLTADNNYSQTIDDNTGETGYQGLDGNPHPGEFTVEHLAYGTYTLKETKAPDGYELNDASYSVTITANAKSPVFNNGEAIVNQQTPPPAPPTPATFTLKATKRFVDADGNPIALQEGRFSFQLKDKDGQVVSTAKNTADGSVTFDALTFDKTGVYTYTVCEVNDAQQGVEYDPNTHHVIVTVTETADGRELNATITLDGSNYTDDSLTFRNKRTPTVAALPLTGSVTGMSMLAASTLFAVASGLMLLATILRSRKTR
ncbi:VCBS domain-containing protein [Bifidobacterium sp. CP2]|uniref:SpaA isopeptide-forming pilin-related protein n=1 Tax=Bifidobacterium sp. CP2 TaxID=2809025 RepID=UPI001BDCBFA4|nr:FctA domain-containing protein [Bifidobacterium sp. CP2]MBT1180529.1 VCBS domain-containing protein [Bifidobacterium sp. CP2]